LFVEGDNNSFPLIYGRFVERMKESVILYDRLNLVFRWPAGIYTSKASWEHTRATMEQETILGSETERVFYAVFDPDSVVKPPSHTNMPYGLLHKTVRKKNLSAPYKVSNLWGYYAAESFYGDFHRDFMNRQIHGHFRLRYAQHLFRSGNVEMGKRVLAEASQIAFDDYAVHLIASEILMNEGCHELAREELEKASLYAVDVAIIHNNWGCYYFKKGDFESAVGSFSKAVETGGGKPLYYRNLVLALERAGREKEATELGERVNDVFPWEDRSVEEQGPS
jgi:tetratricopeptide (TPR) repeat protein